MQPVFSTREEMVFPLRLHPYSSRVCFSVSWAKKSIRARLEFAFGIAPQFFLGCARVLRKERHDPLRLAQDFRRSPWRQNTPKEMPHEGAPGAQSLLLPWGRRRSLS